MPRQPPPSAAADSAKLRLAGPGPDSGCRFAGSTLGPSRAGSSHGSSESAAVTVSDSKAPGGTHLLTGMRERPWAARRLRRAIGLSPGPAPGPAEEDGSTPAVFRGKAAGRCTAGSQRTGLGSRHGRSEASPAGQPQLGSATARSATRLGQARRRAERRPSRARGSARGRGEADAVRQAVSKLSSGSCWKE